MSHIVDVCPWTKFNGGLQLLHGAEDNNKKKKIYNAQIVMNRESEARLVARSCSQMTGISIRKMNVVTPSWAWLVL